MRHDAALKLLMMTVRNPSTRHGTEEHQKPWGSLGFSTESPSGNDILFLKAPLLSNFTSGLFSWAQAVKATLWWAFVYNQGVLKPYFPMIAANKNILLLVQ